MCYSSLSVLGNVISALGDRGKGRKHIPYRDSKLTRILQDCLGGSSRTVLLSTLSSSISFADESANTLLFADRAKNVVSKLKLNQVVDDAEQLVRAQNEILRLRKVMI